MMRGPARPSAALLLGIAALTLVARAQSPELAAALRTADIGEVVRSFGPELDVSLRRVAAEVGAEPAVTTRVLPVIDAQTGRCLGGAQVAGARPQLDEARAVLATINKDMTNFAIVTEVGGDGRELGPEVGVCGLLTVGGE